MQAGVDESDTPSVQVGTMQLDLFPRLAQREIVGKRLVIVQKIFANGVATVTKAQDEVSMTEVRVVAHEVPNDRSVADVDQGLWDGVGVFAQSRAQTAAEEYHFHFSRAPR